MCSALTETELSSRAGLKFTTLEIKIQTPQNPLAKNPKEIKICEWFGKEEMTFFLT